MNIRKVAALAILVGFTSPVTAQDFKNEPIIDEEFKAAKEAVDRRADEECQKRTSFMKQLNCKLEMTDEFIEGPNYRGTKAYCKAHYVGQETEWLKRKYKELDEGRYKAHAVLSSDIPGEVTQEMFKYEAYCVQEILRERGIKTWVPE